jgi:hypothetical protein
LVADFVFSSLRRQQAQPSKMFRASLAELETDMAQLRRAVSEAMNESPRLSWRCATALRRAHCRAASRTWPSRCARWKKRAGSADKALAGVDWLKHHPEAVLGCGAVIVVARPEACLALGAARNFLSGAAGSR